MIPLYISALVFLAILLAVSADWVIKSTSFFASKLKIQSFLIGFLLLGFLTTLPEIFVAFQTIRDGVPEMSVGNLLGGSILLLSFVMGLGAMILGKVILDHGMTIQDIIFSACVIAAPAITLWDGLLTRIEGGMLLLIYIIHIVRLNKEQHVTGSIQHHAAKVRHAGHATLLFMSGVIGMVVASRLIVWIAESVARQFGVSPFIIGLFLVTFGTNLPEFSLLIDAIRTRKRDVAFGDILGSSVINTPILGVVCLIAPFSVPDHMHMRVTLVLLAMVASLFAFAASTKKDINRWEGIGLFCVYGLFILFEMMK